MEFVTQFNYVPFEGVVFDDKDVCTVPDAAYSIQEIYNLAASGAPVKLSDNSDYDENDVDIDSDLSPDRLVNGDDLTNVQYAQSLLSRLKDSEDSTHVSTDVPTTSEQASERVSDANEVPQANNASEQAK